MTSDEGPMRMARKNLQSNASATSSGSADFASLEPGLTVSERLQTVNLSKEGSAKANSQKNTKMKGDPNILMKTKGRKMTKNV